jgi:hypothetical protein
LLDLCTVTAPHAKTIDCLLHAAADSVAIADASSAPSAEPLGAAEGYEHFRDVLRWTRPKSPAVAARFSAGSKTLRVWLLSPPDAAESLYSARCPGYALEPRIPCLIRRVSGTTARLAAVYDWSAANGRLMAASVPRRPAWTQPCQVGRLGYEVADPFLART